MSKGLVSLVGAGPGDPYLLTLAGWEALQEADCVVYDRLVHPRLLDFAPEDAERIFVGKEAGGRYAPQEKINQLLVDRAAAGKRVVRLKGGDPLIFARGAEEIDALAEAGVEYEIIPGVTAALGAAAWSGIPLTHRRISSLVTFATGHDDPSKPDRIDWASIAGRSGTVVVYMARSKIAAIARSLLDGGAPRTTPIAFVQWGGSNRQRVHAATLEDALEGPPETIGTPMLAIIGEVVSERAATRWVERKPLFGRTVLVMRPQRQAAPLARKLERLGAHVLCRPAIEVAPPPDWGEVDAAIESIAPGDWIVFTSVHAVEGFWSRLEALGRDARALGGVGVAAIGNATAAALREVHVAPDLVPAQFRSESLAEQLAPRVAGRRVFLPRADRAREVLAESLRAVAREVAPFVMYLQRDAPPPPSELLTAIAAGEVDWALLTSGNVARVFLKWLNQATGESGEPRVRLASISPLTSHVVRGEGRDVDAEAASASVEALIEAVIEAEKRG
jgi:uroporphyrinogen III methyltransferase/synthase